MVAGAGDAACRTPYRDAPIRHYDHAIPDAGGGDTCAENGEGLCAACNYVKEAPGWHVHSSIDETGAHTADIITPTSTRYRSKAPPILPGRRRIDISEIEHAFRFRLCDLDAA